MKRRLLVKTDRSANKLAASPLLGGEMTINQETSIAAAAKAAV